MLKGKNKKGCLALIIKKYKKIEDLWQVTMETLTFWH